jgi:hypothetical protein
MDDILHFLNLIRMIALYQNAIIPANLTIGGVAGNAEGGSARNTGQRSFVVCQYCQQDPG